jgi:hypothetical protein
MVTFKNMLTHLFKIGRPKTPQKKQCWISTDESPWAVIGYWNCRWNFIHGSIYSTREEARKKVAEYAKRTHIKHRVVRVMIPTFN